MVALAFLLSVAHWNFLGRREGRAPGFSSELALWLILGGIMGARLSYVTANWTEYAHAPLRILNVREGGLVFYGGWLGGMIALLLFARVRKEPLLPLADFTVSAIPLAHAVGRIGCFLNGCCYGRPTEMPWGVYLEGAVRHPTQLYEVMVNLGVYALIWLAIARKPRAGTILALYLVSYPLGRFVTEFFRGDPRVRFIGLTLAQATSLAMMLAGIILWLYLRRTDGSSFFAPNRQHEEHSR